METTKKRGPKPKGNRVFARRVNAETYQRLLDVVSGKSISPGVPAKTLEKIASYTNEHVVSAIVETGMLDELAKQKALQKALLEDVDRLEREVVRLKDSNRKLVESDSDERIQMVMGKMRMYEARIKELESRLE